VVLPEIPTIDELGIKGLTPYTLCGLVVPAYAEGDRGDASSRAGGTPRTRA
jgi:hypothetical protein